MHNTIFYTVLIIFYIGVMAWSLLVSKRNADRQITSNAALIGIQDELRQIREILRSINKL